MKHKISGPIFLFLLFLLVSSSQAGTVFYQYDGRNNLSKAEYSGGGTAEYSFDQMGNRLNRVVNVPSQDFELHLKTGAGTLPSGINVYVFTASGVYTGLHATTDETGSVSFKQDELPAGDFKFRVDYLGYSFWSDNLNKNSTPALDFVVPHQDITITVKGDYNNDLNDKKGIKVYLFTPSGSYTGRNATTDDQGRAIFSLPAKNYKVRADFLSKQYWSDTFSGMNQTVTIKEGMADITVTGQGVGLSGIKVYAFNDIGAYLGISGVSDEDGQMSFRLPEGIYTFRADYLGNQYWSGNSTLISHVQNPVPISTGGGSFTLTLEKTGAIPMSNINCYLFSEDGSYLNQYKTTSSTGTADFSLSDGTYKIRMDYLGYPFWTQDFTIPSISTLTVTIPHKDLHITVDGNNNTDIVPKPGVALYLFTPGGSYLAITKKTDDQGMAIFNLPEKEYKIRADYLSIQYWTLPFTWTDEGVIIPEGLAQINMKQGTLPLKDIPVYVFSSAGTYLGITAKTDISGQAMFRLPQGTYKLRGDYQGSQYWGTLTLSPHMTNSLEINTGGGSFGLTVKKQSGSPIAGIPVYAFSSAGSYLGISKQTDAAGFAAFDLSIGRYKFRADYLGYSFWTDIIEVPLNLSNTLTIPHQNTAITVNQVFQTTVTPLKDIKVYLFKGSGSYLGTYAITSQTGQVSFYLPPEDYKIRADYLGQQYWSGNFTWEDRTVNIGYGLARLSVTSGGHGTQNVPVYLFSSTGSYLGLTQKTNASGNSEFLIPAGTYKIRADYNNTQNWTDLITVNPDEEINTTITLP
jgi:hypothetical protein